MDGKSKLLGNINKATGVALDYSFKGIIGFVKVLVTIFASIRSLFLIGGFFMFFIFMLYFPFGLPLLFLLFIFPFLGKIAVSYLEYVQYMVTEYFYEKADFYLLGKDRSFEKMGDYGTRFERMRERKRQQEEEERARARQKQWEEFFENIYSGGGWYYTDFTGNSGSFGGYTGGGYQNGQGQSNMGYTGLGFVQKYEDSTKILGVSNDSDKYEIKLAYRKLAKQYHPDLNKSEGATEMFQKIGEAYEFLSDENIAKYKRIKKDSGVH